MIDARFTYSPAKVRVAHVLEATTGGTRTHLNLVTRHLDRSRFVPSLFCSTLRDAGFKADVAAYRDSGIPVSIVDMCSHISPLHDLKCFWQLYRHFKQSHFDVVHTHSSKAGILGRFAARCARVRVTIHTPHVFAFQQTSNRLLREVLIWAERIAGYFTDCLLCVSEAEAQLAVAAHVVPALKVMTVSNAVEIPDPPTVAEVARLRRGLQIPESSLVVGTVAHFRPQKALENFVEVASQVHDKHPDAIFLIIGAGDTSSVEALVKARGLTANFRMFSMQPPLWSIYALMDVFALSSRWEGMPYALLEAMAAARPVVAPAVGGCAEVVLNGACGILTPQRDIQCMAQAISLLLAAPALRSTLGSAARARIASEYHIETRIKQLEEIYEILCAQPAPPRHTPLVRS